jgi:hypothetical protein
MRSIDILDSFLKYAETATPGGTQMSAPQNNLVTPAINNGQPFKRAPITSAPVNPGGNTTMSGSVPKPATNLNNPKIK